MYTNNSTLVIASQRLFRVPISYKTTRVVILIPLDVTCPRYLFKNLNRNKCICYSGAVHILRNHFRLFLDPLLSSLVIKYGIG